MKSSVFRIFVVAAISITTTSIFAPPYEPYEKITSCSLLGFEPDTPSSDIRIQAKRRYDQKLKDKQPGPEKTLFEELQFGIIKDMLKAEKDLCIKSDKPTYALFSTIYALMTKDFIDTITSGSKQKYIDLKNKIDNYLRDLKEKNVSISKDITKEMYEKFEKIRDLANHFAISPEKPVDETWLKNQRNFFIKEKDFAFQKDDNLEAKAKLEKAIYYVFPFTFVDQTLRNEIVESLLKLAKKFDEEKNRGIASTIASETIRTIDKEWKDYWEDDKTKESMKKFLESLTGGAIVTVTSVKELSNELIKLYNSLINLSKKLADFNKKPLPIEYQPRNKPLPTIISKTKIG